MTANKIKDVNYLINIAVLTGVRYGVWGWNSHAGGTAPCPPVLNQLEHSYSAKSWL